jgi:hypothetical protein
MPSGEKTKKPRGLDDLSALGMSVNRFVRSRLRAWRPLHLELFSSWYWDAGILQVSDGQPVTITRPCFMTMVLESAADYPKVMRNHNERQPDSAADI